ncbi:replication initiation factor domain-containing protein [Geobacter sp. AOG1]|uniref:replication initiation factor domain-containing protein n=1 Tax=Geobacter sp. AOG1 TaxID=1566346 RepID=UPI001CC66901|nr:replication initiation factor domain-containing protein [Geobacter sp. AOG1]GFE58740.1 hypothetical protein AOG1_26200 [Geobacter sp. AOG1]
MKKSRTISPEHSPQPEQTESLCVPEAPGGTAAVSGSAGSVVAKPVASESMAESVTRHAQNPVAENSKYLLSGIDSLDLGFYVAWMGNWEKTSQQLDQKKEEAQGTDGILDQATSGRDFLHLPSGKRNYRYHLQFPEYHIFIAKSEEFTDMPNVYVSINSEMLWKSGLSTALELLEDDLSHYGGIIKAIQPSRCDLSVDFKIPGGLSLEFLQNHRVSRSRETTFYFNEDVLGTYYLGDSNAPIRLRIYNKGNEVLKKGTKLWFGAPEFWDDTTFQDIWRVEFQLRRTALRQFGVNTMDDLGAKLGGIWKYLTGSWFSLRLPDNEKAERRTVHPWWDDVRINRLGEALIIKRMYKGYSSTSVGWYVFHIAGCLPSFAARVNARTYQEAILKLGKHLIDHWKGRDFEKEFLKRAIKLGTIMQEEGDKDEQ